MLDQRLDQQTGKRELTTDLKSEANQQTGTRELTTNLVCWLASELRSVVNSPVPFY
jgi:hypothetical protein